MPEFKSFEVTAPVHYDVWIRLAIAGDMEEIWR